MNSREPTDADMTLMAEEGEDVLVLVLPLVVCDPVAPVVAEGAPKLFASSVLFLSSVVSSPKILIAAISTEPTSESNYKKSLNSQYASW